MARKGMILFVIQIIICTFVTRNESETWNFQTTILGPVEYCTSSTCVSSGARKIGPSFNQYARRMD